MKPDFNNSILNVTSSIMKKYNISSKYNSLDVIDKKIKDSKHVFLVVLDGLGKNVIEEHLNENSFIRKNMVSFITSVYPPTTVAATTACLSGVAPGESGWVGWHQYFKEIKKDVVVFKNTPAYDDEELTINVASKYIPYTPFYENFKGVKCRELFPYFREDGFSKFRLMCKEMVNISNLDEDTYTYCYWANPDALLHVCGLKHNQIRKVVNELDKNLEKAFNKCGDSTSIIVIADHGIIDTEDIVLMDYLDFVETLEFPPSLEGRTTAFKVKENLEDKFVELFNKYFGKYFKLYKKEEFINEGYLGDVCDKAEQFLLDYVSIAIDKYCLAYEKNDFSFKANHAGSTSDEMMIPLVVVSK